MINFSLVTTAIKILFKTTEDFRDRFINNQRTLITIESEQFLIFFVFIERQTTFSTKILSDNRFISKKEKKIIFESRFENSKFFELFASSKKSKVSFNSKNLEHIFFETKNISSKALFLDQKKKFDKSKKFQILFSQISFDDYSLIHQTSLRVQFTHQISRVQRKNNSFQSFHLTNLKDLFITQHSFSFTFISAKSEKTSIISITKTIFSKKYLENVSSTIFRQFNYRSLQRFVQRNINLNFLESIFSSSVRSRSQAITKLTTESYRKQSIRVSRTSNSLRKDSTKDLSRFNR